MDEVADPATLRRARHDRPHAQRSAVLPSLESHGWRGALFGQCGRERKTELDLARLARVDEPEIDPVLGVPVEADGLHGLGSHADIGRPDGMDGPARRAHRAVVGECNGRRLHANAARTIARNSDAANEYVTGFPPIDDLPRRTPACGHPGRRRAPGQCPAPRPPTKLQYRPYASAASLNPEARFLHNRPATPMDERPWRARKFARMEIGKERRRWLARKDSNLQSPDPESGALPIRPLASDACAAPRVYRPTAPSSTAARDKRGWSGQAVVSSRPRRAVRPCLAVLAPAVSPRCP